MNKALIVVDTQVDFCPGGRYPIPNGDKVVGPLNKLISHANNSGWKIFASRDWHKKELFKDKPDKTHCVQNTKGAKYHPDLNIGKNIPIISKGSDELGERHYSAFNGDNLSLHKLLTENNVNEVYIGGLALDYCVKGTALDSSKLGYKTIVIKEATKPVKTPPEDVYRELRSKNIEIVGLSEVVN